MPVPSSITDLSTTAASNSPAGSDPISNNLDDYLRGIQAIVRAESLNKGWERWNHTVTWLSGTTFSVPGDLTSLYTANRRLKFTLAGPTTTYGTVSSSSFGAGVTTVTVTNDSTALTSPISEVQLGADMREVITAGGTIALQSWVQSQLAAAGSVIGAARNAKMSVATAAATATFTADQVTVGVSLSGALYRLASYSQSINLSTTGAGGMDTGSAPASGFVSLYAIYNPTTSTASILACNVSTSSGTIYSGANMPAGYTASALIGVWPTNASSIFRGGFQRDRSVSFGPIEVYNQTSGVPTTLTALSLSSAVPANAVSVSGCAGSPNTESGILSIAASSNGIAQVTLVLAVVAVYDGFAAAAEYKEMPVITAQTIYIKALNSTQYTRITVNGYSF